MTLPHIILALLLLASLAALTWAVRDQTRPKGKAMSETEIVTRPCRYCGGVLLPKRKPLLDFAYDCAKCGVAVRKQDAQIEIPKRPYLKHKGGS